MGKNGLFARFSIALCLTLIFSTPVHAHKLWINATDHSPEIFSHPKYAPIPRAKTAVYFGWGHKLPANDFLQDGYLKDFFMVEPDGNKKDIKPGPGGFKATEITMKQEGGRIVAASINPGFHGDVEGKNDFYDLRYEMYAKTLISVGKVEGNPFSRTLGQRFEIIPLENPATLKPGDFLELKVLLDGKPAKGAEIFVSPYANPQVTFMDTINYKETAKIRLLDYYGPWIITAKLELPATDEFKNKCRKLYFISTLTFELP
ncbi:DUF4198 domain-containing protein [Desulfocicer niacini]